VKAVESTDNDPSRRRERMRLATMIREGIGRLRDEERGEATPTQRPAEWVAAVVGLFVAGVAFAQDREVAAIAAAVLAFLPALITAAGARWPTLGRFRPTEVATAVAGIVAAVILFAGNRDTAALFSSIQALVPALVTVLVVSTTPDAPEVVVDPPPELPPDA
jgi:xanthine/uracil/vitamin C permease (AzgA family)